MSAIVGQDIEQQIMDALVAWLDAQPGIAALTGHDSGNVIPWTDGGRPSYPLVVVKSVGVTTVGGVGRNYNVEVELTSYASATEGGDSVIVSATDSLAHLRARNLREAVRTAVESLGTLESVGLDACPLPGRTRIGRTTLTRSQPDYTSSASLLLTLWVTFN